METQRPRQLRVHQALQVEPLRTKGAGTEIPPAHFRLEGSVTHFESAALHDSPDFVQSTQTLPLSFSKTAVYLAQTLRTVLPLLLMDAVGCLASLVLAQGVYGLLTGTTLAPSAVSPSLFIPGAVCLLTYALVGLYPGIALNPIIELKNLVIANAAAGSLLIVLDLLQGTSRPGELAILGLLSLFAMALAPMMRISVRAVFARTSWWGQPALIIGSHETARRLMKVLTANATSGLRPIGLIDDKVPHDPSARLRSGYIGTLSDVRMLAEKHNIFWVLIATDDPYPHEISRALQLSLPVPHLVLVPEISDFPGLWSCTQDLGGVMGIHHRERLLNAWTFLLKRAFDLAAVILGTLVLSPLLIPLFFLAWISIRIHSPGPMFYGQDRVGRNGRRFKAWKFRTMVLNAEAALDDYLDRHPEMRAEWDARQKLRNDPRIIPGISGFLRLSSLDELPQLWNVLRGEMSLVGPRPFTPDQLEMYGDAFILYRQVPPGMTGLWQISGRNHMTFQERARLDVYYIRNWSWWLDLFILGRTIKTVILREGTF